MEKNFKDNDNEQINLLKNEINSLKANLKDSEDTKPEDNVENIKSKKDEEDLAEAQRLIEEIESRKLD